MKQIITGPFGLLAYHNAGARELGLYPALNAPNCDFARGTDLVAANDVAGKAIVRIPRQKSHHAAAALLRSPTKREL